MIRLCPYPWIFRGILALLLLGSAASVSAQTGFPLARQEVVATRFGTIPENFPQHPEGLTADDDGNVYAASFELTQFLASSTSGSGTETHPLRRLLPAVGKDADGKPRVPFAFNYIYVFGQDGELKTAMPMPSFSVPLGIWVVKDNLYINDVINGNELRYKLPLSPTSVPAQTYSICGGFKQSFPGGDPATFCALNGNYNGPDGRIYMADNGAGPDVAPPGFLKGRIFALDPVTGVSSQFFPPPGGSSPSQTPNACGSTPVSQPDPRTDPSTALDIVVGGFPEFGVNGIAFNRAGTALFMDNMSDGGIFKLTLTNCDTQCQAGEFSTFVAPCNGIIVGPDNMDFDDADNLWVASGQNMTVVALDPQGHVIRQVGSFMGFSQGGSPLSLLQPSGIVFKHGTIFVGNEANSGLIPATTPINLNELKATTIANFHP
ncbi:MAG TPA: hypothetical protein VKZ53_09685 [Candidatus Angelobacter sp.]|nr:hypothetical protein [Candidatus Angelobacter sp.]